MLFATSSGGFGAATKEMADRIVNADRGQNIFGAAVQAVARVLFDILPADRVDTAKLAIAFGATKSVVEKALEQVGNVAAVGDQPANNGSNAGSSNGTATVPFYKKPIVIVGGLALLSGIAFFALRKK